MLKAMTEHSQLHLVGKQPYIIKEEPEDEIEIKQETEVYISDMEFEEEDDLGFEDFGNDKNIEISDEAANIPIEEQEAIVSEFCSTMQGTVVENQLHDASLSVHTKSINFLQSIDFLKLYMKLIKKNIISYTCKVCFFKHDTLNMMIQHCKRHIQFDQNENSSYIICHRCYKRFKHLNHFYRHVNSTHNKQILFCCKKCGKTFTRKDGLQVHIKFLHVRRKGKAIEKEIKHKYVCSICMRSFQREHSLQRHMVEVHEGLRHTCDLCNKQFTQKASVIKHLNAVHYKNKFPCDACGKSFSVKGSLRRHFERTHKKKYFCNYCMEGFERKNKLIKHFKVCQNV